MNITVRRGDTLWGYSRWFRVPLELIEDSNPGLAPSALAVGGQVRIPGYQTVAYTIKAGDTLWDIATARQVELESIYALNPEVQPSRLQVGQRIQLPLRVTWRIVDTDRPYSYTVLTEDLNRLTELYPFIRRRYIGSSVQGRNISAVDVGRGVNRVHINAAIHANEWITSPVLMRQLNDYVLALTNRGELRGLKMEPRYVQTMLTVVPMVNPDGVELVINGPPAEEPLRSQVLEINGGSDDFSGWKANIRGVDLNDQFPALWEREAERQLQQPSPRDYPGTAPLTEPEAIALAELTRQSDYARVLAYHTQGRVIYWGFEGLQPPESETLANEFARVSGYTPVETIDSYAGYKDWFIQDWRRPGFTIELGEGVNPLPLSELEAIAEESLGIFLVSLDFT